MITEYMIWLILGCLPYHIETRTNELNKLVTLKAVFWNYHYLSLSDGRRYLVVQFSIVQKLQSAIWSLLRHFAPTSGVSPPTPTNSLAHLLLEAKETSLWEASDDY